MYVKFRLQVFFYSALLTGGLWVAGCSKNERPIEEARFTTLELKAFSVDTLQLKVLENETMLTDSLTAPDGVKSIAVQYYDAKHRLRLLDANANRLWLDTTIDYKPGFINALTFFQPSAGEKFVWIGPPVNEPLPPTDWLKISISYTHPALPEMVKVVVENSKTGGTLYEATDSFELKKGEFSRYFLGRSRADRRPRMFLYTADGRRKQVAKVEEGSFPTTVNADYNIYLLRKHSSFSGGVYSIRPDKLY